MSCNPKDDETKRAIAGLYNRAAPTYDHAGPAYFAHFGRELVAFAGLKAGMRVLDIACGRGAVLFAAAEAVGKAGSVTGIDFSEGMLQQTSDEITARGLANAGVQRMDAEDLRFTEGSFDGVTCGFALFFFPNLSRALAEMARVLKPGGILAVSTWGTRDPRWSFIDRIYKQHIPLAAEADAFAPKPVLDTAEGVESILKSAGLVNIRTGKTAYSFYYRDEAEWRASSMSHGSRRMFERIEAQEGRPGLERAIEECYQELRAIKQPEGIPQRLQAVLAAGNKAT